MITNSPKERINGTLYEVVELPEPTGADYFTDLDNCEDCAFYKYASCSDILCTASERPDGKDVIFKVKV